MALSPLAGKVAPADLLVDLDRLIAAYHDTRPDPADPAERVQFGTSGHRGSALKGSFTAAHVLAITQAIADDRRARGITGPLFMGRDTHALSAAAHATALEVLAANGITTFIARNDAVTPTPVVSHAILVHNRGRRDGFADGILITPSHNPPEDGGIKYNPPNGGPADTDVTRSIEDRANALLADGNRAVKRAANARTAPTTRERDFIGPYVEDLGHVVDLDAVRGAGLHLGADPLGGASLPYWGPIAERWGLDITVVNQSADPRFAFMPLDHDGRIRMDCSSPYAMAGLIALKDRFDLAFANDPDADRHGIVTPSVGLMNPNHYLAVAIDYLLTHRPGWPAAAVVGKTLVSSGMIDRVVARHGRRLMEVPVGFKWFAPGLFDGSCCFGGEESAGASFVRMDGTVWTTDKDGPLLNLLAAEITARTGRDPGEQYARLAAELGEAFYTRIDTPASAADKAKLLALSADSVRSETLAGDPIVARLVRAPGNGAAIGGLKVASGHGWFVARPSGTEDIVKLYAESFRSAEHLERILAEAQAIMADALAG
jgi:phosphoglucomutase